VTNPESATQDLALVDLPIGVSARIVSIDPSHRPALARRGIRPDVVVEVEDDAPFGGPRIIRLGFARLAIARVVARAIRVRGESGDAAEASR